MMTVQSIPERGEAAFGQSSSRIVKAAQEFEGQLLSMLLAPLEKSFASGEGSGAGSGDYAFMGVQALSAALAQSGGIGIADLLVRQLLHTEVAARGNEGP